MLMDRRSFLLLGATFTAGCVSPTGDTTVAAAGRERIVHAGPAAQYLADGVYTRFRDHGFFIVRQGANLFALSAICTHRKCKLEAEPDQTFYCPCHDSTFDRNGKVTRGPARHDLPVYPVQTDEKGDLLVTTPGE
jgi:nitrite reductase/ring-hydroxylating ferredoxin subunit